MATTEILEARGLQTDPKLLWGWCIDMPQSGTQSDAYAFDMEGWVLGRHSSAVALEILHDGAVLRQAPINMRRPDVAEVFPKVAGADRSGFRTSVGLLGLPRNLELVVQVVFQDKSRVPIEIIRVNRSSLSSGFHPNLQPLILTTLGRSGSVWLTQLLGQHPHILAYRPFRSEPWVASYWMEILKTLGDPASYLQPIVSSDKSVDRWWVGDKPFSSIPPIPDAQLQHWLGRNHVETLVAFFQSRIQEFYDQVAIIQDKHDPSYFVEKCRPNVVPSMIRDVYPEGREIILVRDFRDLLCSVIAFVKKYAYATFYTERAKNEREYFREVRVDALELLKGWKDRSSWAYLLRYEDLILHPEAALEGVLKYLNLESDPVTIQNMMERARGLSGEAHQQHQTSGDPVASIGRWRRDLGARLRSKCRTAFDDILKEFGYVD